MVRFVVAVCLLAMLPMVCCAAGGDTLVDFHSQWCGPCKIMRPVVDGIECAGYAVQRVDIDEQPETAKQYGVKTIPCFVVLRDGKEVDRVVGVTTAETLTAKLRVEQTALRYSRPIGHRSSVVRIYCQDSATSRSIGSGVLVRWGGKIVVLTARHVIKDAIKITVEFCTRRRVVATVLKADDKWDCAVLSVGDAEADGTVGGVNPAEMETGDAAMQQAGSKLESVGYGADGAMASNAGEFVGYRAPNGALTADWMALSGQARQGDSGGPVFNESGRVVGVLWGTDGKEVVCVQAGRVHVVMDAAVVQVRGNAAPVCGPNGCPPPAAQKPSRLPWRKDAEGRDGAFDARVDGLDAKTDALLQAIEAERQARIAGQAPPDIDVQVQAPPMVQAPVDEASNANPLLVVLCAFGGVAVGSMVYFSTKG